MLLWNSSTPCLFDIEGDGLIMASEPKKHSKKIGAAVSEIWKHKFWILFLCLAVLALFSVYSALHKEDSVKATLILRYEQAYEGLNPNGSRFNINELMDEAIMTQAIDLAGLTDKLTVEQLRQSIAITASGSQEPTNQYIASEYTVYLNNQYLPKTITAKSLLNILMITYKNYFLKNYGRNDVVLKIDWSQTRAWEYLEFANIIDVKINNIIAYLESLQTESGTYNYQTEGESFRSLANSLSSFRDVYLNKYTAYVTNNNIFRDAIKYRSKLQYKRFLTNQQAGRNSERYNIYQDALKMYDKAMITFAMIAIYDDTGLKMARTSNGMDDLAVSSLDYAQRLESNTKELKLVDSSIIRTKFPSAEVQMYLLANDMIEEMKQHLEALIARITKAIKDYEESRFQDSLSYTIEEYGVVSGYRLKQGLIVTFGVFVICCMWYGGVGIEEEIKKEKKRREEFNA